MLNKFFDFLKNKEKFSQEDIDGMRAADTKVLI